MPLGVWQSVAYFCHPVSDNDLCFFPTSKRSLLVLNALLAGAWLLKLTVNVPDSLDALFCQLLMRVLQTLLTTGDCVSGRGCYSNKHKQGCWNDLSIAWGRQGSLPGSTVGLEAARAAPGLSISLVLLEKPLGFAASQVGQETREPSGFTFMSSCLLFWTNTAERRFMESKPL